MEIKCPHKVRELAMSIEGKSLEEKKSLLERCVATTLSSKLIGGEKGFFAKMVVDDVTTLGEDSRLSMIGIKKVILAASSSMSTQSMLKSL
jgi:T-complex protein 1 subunit eta